MSNCFQSLSICVDNYRYLSRQVGACACSFELSKANQNIQDFEMEDVDLGFAEPREDASLWLCNRYFPSKIGGRPAWLELEALPKKETLQCKKCKEPMTFLCQIYAPGNEDHNFHRTIYVFVCTEAECQTPNEASNFVAIRSQLPLKNDFYSEDPPEEDGEPQPEIKAKKNLCLVCGCPSTSKCGRCQRVNYCSRKHQNASWKVHKNNCPHSAENDDTIPASVLEKILFPECEIVIEPNSSSNHNVDNENSKDDADMEEKRLKEFKDLESQGKIGTFTNVPDEELEKYVQDSDAVNDKYFRHFKKQISNEPNQIIRYNRCGTPLWITDVKQTVAAHLEEIPKCELCGAARKFEFQIMPQMLILLRNENLDWGVLAVYTCPNSCMIPKEIGYGQECVVKQDILSSK